MGIVGMFQALEFEYHGLGDSLSLGWFGDELCRWLELQIFTTACSFQTTRYHTQQDTLMKEDIL